MSEPIPARERAIAFTLALVGSALPFAITYHAYGAAVERNPVTAALLDIAGWPALALLVPAATIAAFAVFRHVATRGYPTTARAGMWTLAGWCVINSANDLLVGHTLGVPWAGVAVVTTATALPATLALAVPSQHSITAMLERLPSRRQVASLSLSALVVMSVLTGSIVVSTGPALAAGSVIDSFEDGNHDGWNDPNSVWSVTSEDSYNGSQALFVDGSDGGNVLRNDIPNEAVSSITAYFKVAALPNAGGGVGSEFELEQGDNSEIINIAIQNDGTGSVAVHGTEDTGVDIQAGTWYRFTFADIDYSADTTRVEISNTSSGTVLYNSTEAFSRSSSEVAQISLMGAYDSDGNADMYVDYVTKNEKYKEDIAPSTQPVTGRVVDQGGTPVANATVRLTGVNYNNIVASAGETLRDRAAELIDKARNPLPKAFDRNLDVRSQFLGGDSKANVPLVYTREDVGTAPWTDSSDLTPPKAILPADKPLVFVGWDPEPKNLRLQGEHDAQLPGKSIDSGTIIVEQLGPDGSVTNTDRVSLEKTVGGGFFDPSSLSYGELRLAPGIYRISLKNSEVSYPIAVGSPSELAGAIEEDLRNKAGQLTERAKDIRDRFQNNKFTSTTVTTNASGYYTAEVGQNVNTVAVAAYKTGSVNLSAIDPTNYGLSAGAHPRTVLRAMTNAADINGSVYLPSVPQRYQTPTSNADVQLREISFTPYANNSRFQNLTDGWIEQLKNTSFLNTTALQDGLNATKSRLENVTESFRELRKQNDALNETVAKLLQKDFSIDPSQLDINVSSANVTALRQEVLATQKAIAQLQNNLSVSPGDPEVGTDTISQTFVIDNAAIPADGVQVFADYSDGTSTLVSDEYLSVDQSVGTAVGAGQTTVRIEEFPLGETDPAAVSFRVQVAGVAGVGSGQSKPITNPQKAAPPGLQHIKLSTNVPGPDERVTVTLKGANANQFKNMSGLVAYGPDGTQLTTERVDGDSFRFTTNGRGLHRLRATYADFDGNTYTVPFTVDSARRNQPAPPTLRLAASPAAGQYAIVGDDLRAASVSSDASTATTSVTATAGDEVPSQLDVWATDLALASNGDLQLQVVQGEQGQTIDQRVGVRLHLPALPEDGLLWYEAADGSMEPFEPSGQFGSYTTANGQTVITTATRPDGSLHIQQSANPGLIERIRYQVATLIPEFDIGIPMPLSLSGSPAGLVIAGLPLALYIPYRRR